MQKRMADFGRRIDAWVQHHCIAVAQISYIRSAADQRLHINRERTLARPQDFPQIAGFEQHDLAEWLALGRHRPVIAWLQLHPQSIELRLLVELRQHTGKVLEGQSVRWQILMSDRQRKIWRRPGNQGERNVTRHCRARIRQNVSAIVGTQGLGCRPMQRKQLRPQDAYLSIAAESARFSLESCRIQRTHRREQLRTGLRTYSCWGSCGQRRAYGRPDHDRDEQHQHEDGGGTRPGPENSLLSCNGNLQTLADRLPASISLARLRPLAFSFHCGRYNLLRRLALRQEINARSCQQIYVQIWREFVRQHPPMPPVVVYPRTVYPCTLI